MGTEAFLAANAAFYQALRDADVSALRALLARHDVSCVHPNSYVLYGHDAVLTSWARILEHGPLIVMEADAVCVLAGDAGLVTCSEHIDTHVLAATNVYALKDGEVKLVHHQAAATPGGGPPPGPYSVH